MKIEYEFMDGTVMEIKTDGSQDAVMIGGRRLEDVPAGEETYMDGAGRLAEAAGNLRSLADRLDAAADAAAAAAAGASGEGLPSLEDVRAALAGKANAGHAAGVKRLLAAHGAGRLSELDPAEYPVLLAEAEEIWR